MDFADVLKKEKASEIHTINFDEKGRM